MTSRTSRVVLLLAALAAFASLAGLLSCNVTGDSKPDTLTFTLPDSLKASAGKYDTVRLDLYTTSGADTAFVKTLFHGAYKHPSQLADIPLPDTLDGTFLIRVLGFTGGRKTLDAGVVFQDGEQAGAIIVYPIPEIPVNRAPGFTAGLESRSLREGETLSVTIKARDEDGDAFTFAILNLDSLRDRFPNRPGAITVTAAADTLVLRFDPGAAPGNYRFRVSVRDTAGAEAIQVLVLTVGRVNRPPSLAFAPPHTGTAFRVAEGQTLSLRVTATDADSGDAVRLLSLQSPPWPACGSGSYDTASGVFTFTPAFACVSDGEQALPHLVFRASDDGDPRETGEIAAVLTVVDVNTAPRWASGPIPLTGKEGRGMSLELGEYYLGDAERDSVLFSASCGAVSSPPLRWSFIPGFRDSGQKICTLTATDSHQPPASSQLTLQLTIADSARALEVDILSPTRGAVFGDSVIGVAWQIEGVSQTRDTTEKLQNEGANLVRRSFRDSLGNEGFDTVTVYLDTRPPGKVVVRNLGWTNQARPRWTWRSGGAGSGRYRVRLDTLDFGPGAVSVHDTAYTAPWSLAEGRHVLYVQERDEAGNWSLVDSGTARVDLTPPSVAISEPADGHVTNQDRVTVIWSVDGRAQSAFTPTLTEGSQTVSRSVTDSAGNTGSASITVTRRGNVLFVNAGAPASGGDGNSWATAMRTLQPALAKAQNGWEIWIAKGTYKPGDGVLNADTSFVLKLGTSLYGGFAGTEKSREERNWKSNETILSGDQGQIGIIEDNAGPILVGGDNTKLDGIVVEKGYGSNGAAGLRIRSATMDVLNCVFRENHAPFDGTAGGISIQNGSATIRNCDFLRNKAMDFGAISLYAASASITASRFVENEGASGSALLIDGGSHPRIQSCIFQRNSGGSAVWGRGSSTPDFTNCVFQGNSSEYGGGAMRLNNDQTTLINTVFAANSAKNGGAIDLYGGSMIATNCTFYKNQASDSGGAIHSTAWFTGYNSIQIRNSIFWNNQATWWGNNAAIQSDESSLTYLDIDFSNISTTDLDLGVSGPATLKIGTSVFSHNPLFRNPDNILGADGILLTTDDGLTLTGGQSVDAGTAEGTYPTDILGQPRINGPAVDLGAYEQ